MSLKKNVIANYLGQGWVALMGLAFIPVYIKYLGIEAYGLIGIFALLQAWLSLLDMGMTPTLSREMARFTGGSHNNESIRDLLRSIEIIALGITTLIIVGTWLSSKWLALNWLQTDKLPTHTIAQALTIMGFIVSLRLLENIYRGCIIGLQKQVVLNVINSIIATLRGLGAVGALAWISPTVDVFFLWQGILSFLNIALLLYVVYSNLPSTQKVAKFSLSALQQVGHYAGGMFSTTFLALLLTQTDKIILSKLLTLETFGYYTLATVVAGILYPFITPITQAFYPRFNELIAKNDYMQFNRDYHKAAQLLMVVVGSIAAVMFFFPSSFLYLWTNDIVLTQKIAHLASLLVLGNFLNILVWLPASMYNAHGHTKLGVLLNISAILLIIPAILIIVPKYGIESVAWIWITLNLGYVIFGAPLFFYKIKKVDMRKWYLNDITIPALIIITFVFLISQNTTPPTNKINQVIYLLAIVLLTIGISLLSTDALFRKKSIMHGMKKYFKISYLH